MYVYDMMKVRCDNDVMLFGWMGWEKEDFICKEQTYYILF